MTQHKYPGINVDLKYPRLRNIYVDSGPIYDVCGGFDDTPIQVREVFMMNLMDRLTDKPDWNRKVFDDTIVSKWRKEALEAPEKELFDEIMSKSRMPRLPFPQSRILTEGAFNFCIRELRAKAAHFEKTGLVPTLDSIGRAIVKSDTLVTQELKSDLRTAFDQLRDDQVAADAIDWHPGTGEMVQDLVHPSLYPFVYGASPRIGCSPFLQEEVVGRADAIERWAGKGTTAPADPTLVSSERGFRTVHGEGNDWSAKYQWLPANIVFQEDDSVRFSSYINNLHPRKYAHVYGVVEKLIDVAIPAWDQILGDGVRRTPRFSVPEWADDRETEGLWPPRDPELLSKHLLKPTKADIQDIAQDCQWSDEEDEDGNKIWDRTPAQIARHTDDVEEWRWERIRDAILPDPDSDPEVNYAYSQSIRQLFKDSGLQVIVKMARIELTPEKPDFPAGGWHIEGMMNERICATALYYLDSENVTPSFLSFRMKTDRDPDDLQNAAGQNAFDWLGRVYGADFSESECLQYYGRVETCEGRLLAFPNVFQHQVSSFSLKDRTKPGHRCFIALWLVDPSQRIVSTANVPPQQLDWWAEATFGGPHERTSLGDMPPEVIQLLVEKHGLADKLPVDAVKVASQGSRLPQELADMLREGAGIALNGLMSLDEANEHRLQLMAERTVFASNTNEGSGIDTYNFCEH
ncbi:hypothetical protein GQ53DRAFT_704441 [Thozetella sp. PMI_491]|nr:hypothetical protein GQ53DRAFT_704441 [Thozetella sp. PMI_491]